MLEGDDACGHPTEEDECVALSTRSSSSLVPHPLPLALSPSPPILSSPPSPSPEKLEEISHSVKDPDEGPFFRQFLQTKNSENLFDFAFACENMKKFNPEKLAQAGKQNIFFFLHLA
jgi:hypothetical protein